MYQNYFGSQGQFPNQGAQSPPPTQYGAPPTNFAPGPPPTNMFNPNAMGPPSTGGPPGSQQAPVPQVSVPQPPRSNVQFFSLSSNGAPVPSNTISMPPTTGGMPPPPTTGGSGFSGMSGPPPPVGPAVMAGPPTGFYSAGPPTGGPPPPQTEYPGQMYGAPPPQTMIGMPSAFDSSPNLAAQAAGGPPDGMGAPLPTLSELDLSIQCSRSFMTTTVGKLVSSQATAAACRLPLGLVCQPMAGDVGTNNEDVEVVDFGATGIIRCKRCRTYINPYVSWIENGRRWRCNICGMLNDVPTSYFSHLDANGQRRDRDQRPELSRCSVEFVAPGDYMVRPPQPPVYFFVVDVSLPSIQSGMLGVAVKAIKDCLNSIPGTPRTQIGFLTFDSSIHFYNLKPTLHAPQMIVCADISDVLLPVPEDLLVNLQDARAVVESLLDSLPNMFASNQNTQSCTGSALNAAKRIIQHVGGKLLLFQTSLPNLGEGSLKLRENPRLYGTEKEHTLLTPEDQWYSNNAIDCSRLQIAVDTFLFSPAFTDLATISILSKYSSGSTYYYPSFHAPRDGDKFSAELSHCLTRSTAFESVMRIRATRGMRITNFYGNYYIRGSDLMALPNCTSDSTFAIDLAHDEAMLQAQAITVQAALLYTSSAGERRIRVHTMILPVTQNVTEMMDSFDIDVGMNLLAKQAIDVSHKTGFEQARQRIHQTTIEIFRSLKSGASGGGMVPGMPGAAGGRRHLDPSSVPPSLQLLPLYSMSLQKASILRGGTEVRIDERAFYHQLVSNMNISETRVFIYPRLFSLHDIGNEVGLELPLNSEGEEDVDVPTAGPNRIRLPALLNLSHERLNSDGLYLLENGSDLFLWIGRAVNPALLQMLFEVNSLEGVDMSMLKVKPEASEFATRIWSVVGGLRAERSRYLHLHCIREGDGHAEAYFARFLVEDRANFPGGALSYPEYYALVIRHTE